MSLKRLSRKIEIPSFLFTIDRLSLLMPLTISPYWQYHTTLQGGEAFLMARLKASWKYDDDLRRQPSHHHKGKRNLAICPLCSRLLVFRFQELLEQHIRSCTFMLEQSRNRVELDITEKVATTLNLADKTCTYHSPQL